MNPLEEIPKDKIQIPNKSQIANKSQITNNENPSCWKNYLVFVWILV